MSPRLLRPACAAVLFRALLLVSPACLCGFSARASSRHSFVASSAATFACRLRPSTIRSADDAENLASQLKSALVGSFFRLTDYRVARASHILLKGYEPQTVQQLEEWKQEIADDPDKFAEIASAHSLCPSRSKGGDLGFFTRGKMVRDFDTVVFTEPPGAVYGPVRTDFGLHLIFVHSCRTSPEREER